MNNTTKLAEYEKLKKRAHRFSHKLVRRGAGYRLWKPGERPGKSLTAGEVRVSLSLIALQRRAANHVEKVKNLLRHEDVDGIERRRVAGIPATFLLCGTCGRLLLSKEDDNSGMHVFEAVDHDECPDLG